MTDNVDTIVHNYAALLREKHARIAVLEAAVAEARRLARVALVDAVPTGHAAPSASSTSDEVLASITAGIEYGIVLATALGDIDRTLLVAQHGGGTDAPVGIRSLWGIAPDLTGGLSSEEYIRRKRDAADALPPSPDAPASLRQHGEAIIAKHAAAEPEGLHDEPTEETNA